MVGLRARMNYMEHFRAIRICSARPQYSVVCGLIVKFISSVQRCVHRTLGVKNRNLNSHYQNLGFFSFLSGGTGRANIGYAVLPVPLIIKSQVYLDINDACTDHPYDFIMTGSKREPNQVRKIHVGGDEIFHRLF